MGRSGPLDLAGDRHWRGSARFAVGCALIFCAMTLLVDWDADTLSPLRALLWITLSAAVFTVLLPHRVSAGPGWLAVRGPWCQRMVRTDALAGARQCGDVAPRLVLWDAYGHHLELDPRVLAANPLIWHEGSTPDCAAPSSGAHCAKEQTSCNSSATGSTMTPPRRSSERPASRDQSPEERRQTQRPT